MMQACGPVWLGGVPWQVPQFAWPVPGALHTGAMLVAAESPSTAP